MDAAALEADVRAAKARSRRAADAKWRAAASASRLFKISQARRAAVPFKSVLADAAVGEVLLFFSVEAGMTRTASSGKANSSATIWRILVLSPCPISVPPVETWIVPSR